MRDADQIETAGLELGALLGHRLTYAEARHDGDGGAIFGTMCECDELVDFRPLNRGPSVMFALVGDRKFVDYRPLTLAQRDAAEAGGWRPM